MKQIITLCLALAVASASMGQDCKFSKNEVDEFTGKKVIQTKYKAVNKIKMNSEQVSFSVAAVNDITYLYMHIFKQNVFSIREGSSLMFKSSSDEIIELRALETVVSDRPSIAGGLWSLYISYALHENQIEQLKSNKLSKIRIYGSDGYFEYEIRDDQSLAVSDMIYCVLNIDKPEVDLSNDQLEDLRAKNEAYLKEQKEKEKAAKKNKK